MDQIAKIQKEAMVAYWVTGGKRELVETGYRTKCHKDAFERGWLNMKWHDDNLFPFLKRIEE